MTWPVNSLPRDHDLHVQAWINEYLRPGDVFYDIGANKGFFSEDAANKGAEVYAFEPVPSVAIEIPNLHNLTVITVAIWDKFELLTLELAPDSQHVEVRDVQSKAYPWMTLPRQVMVQGVPLSSISLPRPKVVKSDTQGCEARMLRGTLGSNVLDDCEVLILERSVECLARHGDTVDDLDNLVRKIGFRIEGSIGEDIICKR